MTILRLRLIATPKICTTAVTSQGSSCSSLLTPSYPNSTPSPNPPTLPLSHSLFVSPVCSPRALETEWSECEPPIVEINGI